MFGFTRDVIDADAVEVTAEGYETRHRRGAHVGHSGEALLDLLIERDALRAVIARARQIERDGEQMIALNPRLDLQQAGETLDHERARRQEHHREGELSDGKHSAS